MKRYTLLLILSLCVAGLFAQTSKEEFAKRWEEMKAKRAAFYTEKICLTADEAQVFWPVFNELQQKKGQLHHKISEQFRNAKKDEKGERIIDFVKVTDDMINFKVQESSLDKCYHEKFKKILSPEKLFKYYTAEREWTNNLLKEMDKRGGDKK